MQGVLIASADAAVRKSLAAILHEGRTLHECATVSECLSLAAAHKMDMIVIDDPFDDGGAEDLIRRLHSLGYGVEIVPILLSKELVHLHPHQAHGVHYYVAKPFDVKQVETVVERIAHIHSLREPEAAFGSDRVAAVLPEPDRPAAAAPAEPDADVDVREIAQRFRRLLADSLDRDELVKCFVENLQEQFEVDNVVILFPARREPVFRIAIGNISDEVKKQFFIPLDDPLVATLIRLGEPIWVHDAERLGRTNTATALRYGERLAVQVLAPVLSQGRMLALVGLSRSHRFANGVTLIGLLRQFFTFFSKALEIAEIYEKTSQTSEINRGIVDAFPLGLIAINPAGRIRSINARAAELLHVPADELADQPIERAGSILADAAREVLHTGQPAGPCSLPGRVALTVTTVPLGVDGRTGAFLILQLPASEPPQTALAPAAGEQEALWRNMASAVAHNFKNALVPVKTCAELLPERFESESFRRSFFEIVSGSIDRIDEWIEKMLRFSELRADRPENETILLQECMEKGLERAQRLLPDLNVDVTRAYAPDLAVRGNRRYLDLAFFELAQNALDAVQDVAHPAIALRTEAVGGEVMAVVEDNGRGFDEGARASAFQPFASKKLSGLGLGLAYVRRVMTLHGGTVAVLALPQGGTSLQLALPAAENPVAVTESERA